MLAPWRRCWLPARSVALLAGLALLASILTACGPPPKRTLIFGDSLAFEAQIPLRAHGIEVNAFGGTAICDWLPEMRRQTATKTVGTVYLEFVGNYFTACVKS